MGKVAVLGLGPSIDLFDKQDYELVVGVNDIWRYFPADVIVCVDRPSAFTPTRLSVINHSQPQMFYSHVFDWEHRRDFRKINLISGYPDRICDLRQKGFWKSFCSPFVAVQVAWRLHGADDIHLYGVDLLNHPHLDQRLCQRIKVHFDNLFRALRDQGCTVVVHGNGILTA